MFSFARSNGTRPSICDVFLNVCFVSVVNTCKGKYNQLSVLGEKNNKADFPQVQFAFKNFIFKT